MASTVVVATRIPEGHARSIRELARLRRTTVSDVVAKIVCEQVEPFDDDETGSPHAVAA